MKTTAKLWIGIVVLIFLSPLGLILPEHFKAGSAWGEWGIAEIKNLAGYIPKGLEKLSCLYNAPIPGYAPQGWEDRGLTHLSFAYILSAAAGIILTVLVILIIGKILIKKGD